MTPEFLRDIGEALYGSRWQTELARDLGVGDRTMRRWVAGETLAPDGVAADLLAIMRDRNALLDVEIAAMQDAILQK